MKLQASMLGFKSVCRERVRGWEIDKVPVGGAKRGTMGQAMGVDGAEI